MLYSVFLYHTTHCISTIYIVLIQKLGSPQRGCLWEMTRVAQIRVQAIAFAKPHKNVESDRFGLDSHAQREQRRIKISLP